MSRLPSVARHDSGGLSLDMTVGGLSLDMTVGSYSIFLTSPNILYGM